MKSNELLRHLRKLLALNEQGMTDILALGHFTATPDLVRNWLRQENEPEYADCPDLAAAHFIEGLIISKRGPKDDAPTAPPAPLDNNQVLKKLRIAFNLQGDDMHTLFTEVDHPLTKQELDALFRKPGHKNFQPCSDQLLRTFIKGLTAHARPR